MRLGYFYPRFVLGAESLVQAKQLNKIKTIDVYGLSTGRGRKSAWQPSWWLGLVIGAGAGAMRSGCSVSTNKHAHNASRLAFCRLLPLFWF